jgi:hypothetical protein
LSRIVNREIEMRFEKDKPAAIRVDGAWIEMETLDGWRVGNEWWTHRDQQLGETDYWRVSARPPRVGLYMVSLRRSTQRAFLERVHD